MSTIAVKPIPLKWTLAGIARLLAHAVNGQFEVTNFKRAKEKKQKIAFLRLARKLNPMRVIEQINGTVFKNIGRLTAYIPAVDHIQGDAKPKKTGRRAMKHDYTPQQVLSITLTEVVREMQFKYTGLYNLSLKTGHQLLTEITRTVFERLKAVLESNPSANKSCFVLSKCYRKTHPHFGDFQLILSRLHALQDAQAEPREQISEAELIGLDVEDANTLPYAKTLKICAKYSDIIVKRIEDHISSLKDPPEEAARRVRAALRSLQPYLPQIIKQVTSKHSVTRNKTFYIMKIYGEPFLPPKEHVAPLLKRVWARRVVRSQRTHNALSLVVPPQQYSELLALDGTLLVGAKLIVRPANVPLFKTPKKIMAEIREMYGLLPGVEREGESDEGGVGDQGEGGEGGEDNWEEPW